MRRSLLSAVLSLSVLLSTLVMAQDALYTFTPIDVPGALNTIAHGINNSGQIVGWFSDATGVYGFLKDGTTYTPLEFPDAKQTHPYGINSSGQIAGHFYDIQARVHGFVTDGTTFTPLAFPGATNTFAYGINDSGLIVGWFIYATGGAHGFVTDGDTYTSIDVPGALVTQAFGINDSGWIVGFFGDATGTHGFVTDGTTFTRIDAPGATLTATYGINNSDQIVGSFANSTGFHNFVTDGTTFTPLDVPGATQSTPFGINDSAQIVGQFIDAAGGFHGYLATMDTTPPVLTVSANPTTLSPPNGKRVTVAVSGTMTDGANGSGLQTASAVYQVTDEYGQIEPSGRPSFGPGGQYTFTVALEASRRGTDRDGRRYTITVSATDQAGNRGDALTLVTVPHG